MIAFTTFQRRLAEFQRKPTETARKEKDILQMTTVTQVSNIFCCVLTICFLVYYL